MQKKLKLTLKAASNPDYPGRLLPKPSIIEVATFTEADRAASAKAREIGATAITVMP